MYIDTSDRLMHEGFAKLYAAIDGNRIIRTLNAQILVSPFMGAGLNIDIPRVANIIPRKHGIDSVIVGFDPTESYPSYHVGYFRRAWHLPRTRLYTLISSNTIYDIADLKGPLYSDLNLI